MLNSQALEVGIGLILVFLLVSLILTAVRESIEAWFKTRAVDLERAIAELLNDRKGETDGLRDKFYKHPLIAALYPGEYHATAFDEETGKPVTSKSKVRSWLTWFFLVPVTGSGNKPTYIPKRQFAETLLALARNGELTGRVAKAILALRPPAKGDLPEDGKLPKDDAALGVLAAKIVKALTSKDADALRAEIEEWYDGAMDRASGWFKRRTQVILFFLGLVLAVVLNINAVTIGQALSRNAELRDAVVQIAGKTVDEYPARLAAAKTQLEEAAAKAETEQTVPGGEATPGGDGGTAANASDPVSESAQGTTGTKTPTGTPGDAAAEAAKAALLDDAARAQANDELARDLNGQLLAIGLPIGWSGAGKVAFGEFDGYRDWVLWIAGFLVTAFAATLGAPFWFDLLNKFMVIRSTVKPKEKSGEEGSEDRARQRPVTSQVAQNTASGSG